MDPSSSGPPLDFARAFGAALEAFLREKEISVSEAAAQLGLGKRGRARLNAYFHDTKNGKRAHPNAEILYSLCARLGFSFQYNGYEISAKHLVRGKKLPVEAGGTQQPLRFDTEFELKDSGSVRASLKRTAGRLELSVRLNATGS